MRPSGYPTYDTYIKYYSGVKPENIININTMHNGLSITKKVLQDHVSCLATSLPT